MKYLKQIYDIALRELLILRQNHIYRFCMVLFPVLVIFFFTSILDDGLSSNMPVGVVDLDNTSTTRALGRKLDGFQMSKVVAHYPSVAEARRAIQRNFPRYKMEDIPPTPLSTLKEAKSIAQGAAIQYVYLGNV